MTPFASVAMLEKLALLKIARCRAPAFSSTSSACLRKLTSPALSETPILLLVVSFPLTMVLPPVTDARACGIHAHRFSVRDPLGDHRPGIHHATFLDSRADVHYVALIEGLPIVLVHRIKVTDRVGIVCTVPDAMRAGR